MTVERIHIYPVDSKNRSTHRTTKSCACWCEPEYMQLCAEADDHGNCVPTCWRCDGRGMVRYKDEPKMLIVHRDGQLRRSSRLSRSSGSSRSTPPGRDE